MNIEEIRSYCLSKKAVTESFPFNETTLVFKVKNKMFLLMNIDSNTQISVKCNPELAVELREEYSFIEGAYHMNKKHWNSIVIEQGDYGFIKEQIDNSYILVVKSLPKKIQTEIFL